MLSATHAAALPHGVAQKGVRGVRTRQSPSASACSHTVASGVSPCCTRPSTVVLPGVVPEGATSCTWKVPLIALATAPSCDEASAGASVAASAPGVAGVELQAQRRSRAAAVGRVALVMKEAPGGLLCCGGGFTRGTSRLSGGR